MTDPTDRVADLTFKARALAQAHPLTVTASSYREQMIEEERRTQPMSEFADWAGTAFLVGYCIRRIEEADVGDLPETTPQTNALVPLAHETARLSDEVKLGRPAGVQLLEQPLVEELLDTVISTEIDKRSEHWKGQISNEDWAMFESYVAWWVIHGYSMRAAEISRSAASSNAAPSNAL